MTRATCKQTFSLGAHDSQGLSHDCHEEHGSRRGAGAMAETLHSICKHGGVGGRLYLTTAWTLKPQRSPLMTHHFQ